jgi:hypothetical protein
MVKTSKEENDEKYKKKQNEMWHRRSVSMVNHGHHLTLQYSFYILIIKPIRCTNFSNLVLD